MTAPLSPRTTAQNPHQAFAVKALEAPCQQARQSFRAWADETLRARAAVEASARTAVADCYRFGLHAFEDPAAFDILCARLGIRQTRSDRAANPFIRVVKAAFGREIEDGSGGPPRWEWISDSQVNKYATVLLYAQSRGIRPDHLPHWLAEDYANSGEAIPMSISRRLREARDALRSTPAALPAPSKPRLDAQAILKAVDALPPSVEITPLTLRGLGAPDDAALIVSLGEEDAVRLSHLPEELMVQVLGTIARYYRRAESQKPPLDRPFARLAALFRQSLSALGRGACLRIVNHQDHCAVLMGGGADGLIVRADLPPLPDVPRRRVFALTQDQARALAQTFANAPQSEEISESFRETNFARPGGLLEQRVDLLIAADSHSIPLLEIPEAAAAEPLPHLPLTDIGISQWNACALLDQSELAAFARMDSRAKRWKEIHQTRSGRAVTRRASRIYDVKPDVRPQGPVLDLTLRRGPAEDAPLSVRIPFGAVRHDRISRAALGNAAQFLLKRRATENAALLIAYGALWLLTGSNPKTGERLTVGIPVLDDAGKPVARGFRDARFEPDPEPHSTTLARAAQRLGVPPNRFIGPSGDAS